jgi:hypothetical protein
VKRHVKRREPLDGDWEQALKEIFEKLHNVDSTKHFMIAKSRKRWNWNVAHMENIENRYKILVWRHYRQRPLVRYRRRWEKNIKVYRKEGGCEGLDWSHLAQDSDQWRTHVNMATNVRSHKRWENSRAAERLSAPLEGHYSMELKCAIVNRVMNFRIL